MQLMFMMGAAFAVCFSNVATVEIPICTSTVVTHESRATTQAPSTPATTDAVPAAFEEPLCKNKTCKNHGTCMVAEKCTAPDSCVLEPVCAYREPIRGVQKSCQVGEPLIHEAFHGYVDYGCWKGGHCPKGFICSPQNVCCRPARPDIKSGACPEMNGEVKSCENQCQSDADCSGEQKCCQTSASCPKKHCTLPDTGSLGWLCSLKVCSTGYECKVRTLNGDLGASLSDETRD